MANHVTVRYFAAVRELLGARDETIVVETTTTVAAFFAGLAQRHPELGRLKKHLRIAVNLEFAEDTDPVRPGDEVALIPPVAGGNDAVQLCEEALDEAAVAQMVASPRHGAVVTFVGVVRDHSQGRDVSYLEYEAYPEMVVGKLQQIRDEAGAKWPECQVAVHHRVGRLRIGDAAVVIAAGSPHRADAFAACQYTIDRIKEIVPIWKREVGPDGSEWVGMGS